MALETADYAAQSSDGRLWMATAIVTAPVIFSTAAGTGGPLLWNPSGTAAAPNKTVARIVKVGFAVTTASAVAGAIGFTGGGGQGNTAPTSTTAIDSVANLSIGNPLPRQCNVYRVGTPAAAGAWFMPWGMLSTAAVTAVGDDAIWFDVNRLITVPPGSWLSVAASATLTSAVAQITLIWEELNQP